MTSECLAAAPSTLFSFSSSAQVAGLAPQACPGLTAAQISNIPYASFSVWTLEQVEQYYLNTFYSFSSPI